MVEIVQLIRWPAVALIVAVFAILIFRNSITNLLSRLKRVGVGAINLDTETALAAASNQSETKPVDSGLTLKAAPDAQTEDRLRQVRNFGMSPIVQEQQKLIRAEIEKLGVPQHEQIEILTRHLAVTQLLFGAEFIYRTIFGSQIAVLKFLNTSANGATRAQLSEFYKNAKTQFPQLYKTYSFDQYLQYLLTQRLVTTQDHDRYFITVGGQEFLKWIPAARVTENKLF